MEDEYDENMSTLWTCFHHTHPTCSCTVRDRFFTWRDTKIWSKVSSRPNVGIVPSEETVTSGAGTLHDKYYNDENMSTHHAMIMDNI